MGVNIFLSVLLILFAFNGGSISTVYLHSGEFFLVEPDMVVPGRGFDFVFSRQYQSQVVHSGPLGFGWDGGYFRRLQYLPSGDVLYFDGTGRRDKFKARKSGGNIN